MNAPLLARLLDGRTPHASEVGFIADRLFEATTPEVEETAWILALVPHRFDPLVLRTFARTMRARAVPFREAPASRTVDLCGSGGARRATFNVSTTAAFVVRAAGILVAKHGNRSARGHTGSTDLLEALGLPVADSVEFARESFRRFGLAFLHAPLFHPATRRAASVRRQLGVPTVFNLLGPLTNPARVRCQLVGCADPKSAAVLAEVLPQLGVRRGLTVTGKDGSDEWDPTGTTLVWGWRDGRRFRARIAAQGLLDSPDRRGSLANLEPGPSAQQAERILAGSGGAGRGAVLLTAGSILWIRGVVPTLRAGVERATEALDSGKAEALLRALQDLGQSPKWQEGA